MRAPGERGAEEPQAGIETFSEKDEHHLPKTIQQEKKYEPLIGLPVLQLLKIQ